METGSTSSKPSPPDGKPPFDVPRAAMLLLSALVIGALLTVMTIIIRCTIWFIPTCADSQFGGLAIQWFEETVPVLVALIMTGRRPPN